MGGRRIETLPVHSVLTRCEGRHLPFDWSLNPYRGCHFACRYCYARYTHEWLGLDPADEFDDRVLIKEDIDAVLARDLARLRRRRDPRRGTRGRRSRQDRIAIGTATDPYQPAEHRHGLTRACLKVFLREESRHPSGYDLSITTKSDLVVRDIELLQRLSEGNRISVNVTITTVDGELARALEPRAPRPKARLETMATIADAGIEVNAFVMPILPGLTDREEDLDLLFRQLAGAGVQRVVCEALFLRSPSKEVFFRFLKERFPELEPEYRRRYEDSVYASPLYVERLRALVQRLRERHGLIGARASDGTRIRQPAASSTVNGPLQRRRRKKLPQGRVPRSTRVHQLQLFEED